MYSDSFSDLNHLNLKFAQRIEISEKEIFYFRDALDLLQTVQIQRDFFVNMDSDFKILKLSKKESDDSMTFRERIRGL